MADYKIELGIGLRDSDFNNIKSKIESLEGNPIKLKVDAETKELTNTIKEALKSLTSGTKNALTFDTTKIESSLNDVNLAIKEIKTSLSTLDGKSGMQSLVDSVNQIVTALNKAERESNDLVKSLSALSKQDLSINLGLDLGLNKSYNPTAYGRAARTKVMPQLDAQIDYLERSVRESLQKEVEAAQNALSNSVRKFKYPDGRTGTVRISSKNLLNLEIAKDADWDKAFAGLNDTSYIKKMEAQEKHIEKLKNLASLKGVDLTDFNAKFSKSATELIDDVSGISNAADIAEDTAKKLRNAFGGIDVESLSTALKPISEDITSIRTALEGLSSGVSIDGLTASFNRLSEVLDKLEANVNSVKNTLNTGFSNIAPTNNAVKAAQQTGQKIGETITQSAKEHINLDDVVEKETRALMKEYGISAKNKTAKDDIKGALTNYVNEIKNGGTIVNDELFGSFNTADAALRKVTDTIARHKKEVIELDTLYEDLLADIKSVNKGKGATKVRLSDMRAEWGDDYKANKDLLGSWFSDKYTDGIGIDSWVKSKSWSSLLDLSGSHQDIANQLVELVKKAKTKNAYSGDELFKKGFLNIDDVEASVKESAANISAAQQKMAQSSTESANTVSQAEAKKQQAYEETKRKLDEVNRDIAEHEETIADPAKMASIGDMDAIQSYMDEMDTLAQKKKELETTLKSLGKSDDGQSDIANTFNEAEIEIGQAEDRIESLRNALKSLGIGDAAIDNIIKDFEKLDVTVKKVTGRLNDNGSMKLTVKGVNNDGDTVTQTTNINADNTIGSWSKSVTKGLSEAEQKLERLKTVTKEINSLKIDLFKFEDAGNIERATNQLNELENEASELRATLQQKYNITSFDEVDNIARQGEEALNSLIAKAEEAKAKLAKSIKVDIDLGNFENEMDAMRSKFNSLSDANIDLRNSVNTVEQAYKEMLAAASANTGDEVADRERLIQAEREYAAALKVTDNLIKKQARADKIDADRIRLEDDRAIYQAKIDSWLTKNSAATEKFGAKLKELRAAAETADRVELNHLEKELVKVDKAADKAGLKMMSLGDRIKSKAKEYMAYFSVAEVFMYVEQGLREMFNTVKEIDTAMTGLYRVTNLTAAEYDTLFDNMISSAKEYGATLNDIINATTDWVRAGFDANTSLGLAEVTTMYQHISDLDYDTAAENLITAYNGFKDELNGAFSGDTVAAVNYIADILNELDKQNCPLVV